MSSNPISPGGSPPAFGNGEAVHGSLQRYSLEQLVTENPGIAKLAGMILIAAGTSALRCSSNLPEPFRSEVCQRALQDLELGVRAISLCIQAHAPRQD